MSRATYVKAPADKPMGIDLNQFEQDNNAITGSTNVGQEIKVINEIMEQHGTLIGVLQRRLSSINTI